MLNGSPGDYDSNAGPPALTAGETAMRFWLPWEVAGFFPENCEEEYKQSMKDLAQKKIIVKQHNMRNSLPGMSSQKSQKQLSHGSKANS